MSISVEAFRVAQESELANWAKDAQSSYRVLHEMVEHASIVGPLRSVVGSRQFKRALEVGCGCYGLGFLAVHFFDRVEQIDCVDPLPRLRIVLQDQALGAYISSVRNRLCYIQCVGEALPFVSGAYDLIACINVVDHARDPGRIMREIGRVLKPDGVLIFAVSTLSVLGEWLWRFRRRLWPDRWLFRAHPHTLPVGSRRCPGSHGTRSGALVR